MRTHLILTLLIALCFSYSTDAQNRKRPHQATIAPEDKKPVNTFKTPTWAPKGYDSKHHIYFPDYETFYDPQRGYITRDKNSWVASPSMPLFLSNADMKKTRIQILEDIGLDTRPETSYPKYMQMYPPDPNGKVILVPVPKSVGQPGAQ